MNETDSPSRPTTYVWPSLTYVDAPAAIEFLVTAFGFVATAVYKADDDDTVVHHAELAWSPGGGIDASAPNATPPGGRLRLDREPVTS